MLKPWVAVLVLLAGLQRKYGRDSITVTQKKMLKLLEARHGVVISRRTLCRFMRLLRSRQLLVSVRRHRRTKMGLFDPRASNHRVSGAAAFLSGALDHAKRTLASLTDAPRKAHSLLKTPDIKKRQVVTEPVEPLSYEQMKVRLPWYRQPVIAK